MPHKHRRREVNERCFDLAPSQLATPLPAYENRKTGLQQNPDRKRSESALKRKRGTTSVYSHDDTPRAFSRLMQLSSGQRLRSGLDDGERLTKKKKRPFKKDGSNHAAVIESSGALNEKSEQLKIMPGERLADFAARVNQALPVAGLSRKGKHVDGVRERQTKTEQRLHKMYAEWREEEKRRKQKLEELQEQQEEADEEKKIEFGGQNIHLESTGRRGKRRRMVGEVDEDDDDPWAVLETKRDVPKGLHDVVHAPPTMKVVPKEKFKVRNGAKVDVANVPSSSGSLKRREELGEARKEIIERYRAIMKGGRL